MKVRLLVLVLVLPFLLAGVTGCGDDPSVKPKAPNTGKNALKDNPIEKQKPVSD